MDDTCNTHWSDENWMQNFSLEARRDHLGDMVVDGRLILKCALNSV
jgi:hypothetical protein